jgi:hypothetical protein
MANSLALGQAVDSGYLWSIKVEEGGCVALDPKVQAQLDRIEAMLKQLLERK